MRKIQNNKHIVDLETFVREKGKIRENSEKERSLVDEKKIDTSMGLSTLLHFNNASLSSIRSGKSRILKNSREESKFN